MNKFVFYQAINSDGSRTNHGVLLNGRAVQKALEDIYLHHREDDVMSVGLLGTVECARLLPVVMRKVVNQPTDAEGPESASLAIELSYPVGLSEKAKTTLEVLAGTEALYYYMEHFIITDESLELSKPRWEGDTLEAMEKWLEEQADMNPAEK